MNGFKKLRELQKNIKAEGNYNDGDVISKKNYVSALNKTFPKLQVKESDIHKGFDK